MSADSSDRTSATPRSHDRATLIAIVAVLLAIGVAMGGAIGLAIALPFPSAAEVTAQRVIMLQSSDGEDLLHKGNSQLAPVAAKDMPDDVVNAVLSMEDRRFYEHHGLNFFSLLRAFKENFIAGKVVAGGSTITQQLAKNLFVGPERTYQRKLREAAIAMWIEHIATKDQILTSYLNNVYLGSGAIGFPAAARRYFGKSVGDLSLSEAAMLAGMISAPSQDDPFHDLAAARKRAATVLDAMVENGKLTEQAAFAAKLQPATPSRAPLAVSSTGWFVDWVYNKVASVAPPHGGTVSVRTTLDLRLQEVAANIVKAVLAKNGKARHVDQAALIAMRPDGSVVAMVGGRDYGESEYNRAVQAERQPGSAFKLFDYYAALRRGYALDDEILDAPVDVHGWQPENYGHRYRGRVTLAEAFANSLNDATVRLSQQVGIDQVIAAARDLGLHAKLPRNASIALGTAEVTLLDLTSAYAAVRAGKAPVVARGISAVKTLSDSDYVSVDLSSASQHSLGRYQDGLISLLRGVVEHGTGRGAALDGFSAGKTGTAQDYRDAWFIGFDDTLVVGVWVGNDDHSPMDRVVGGSLPATIWKQFMEQARAAAPAAPEPSTQVAGTVGQSQEPPSSAQHDGNPLLPATSNAQCNVQVCQQFYHSFRESDCTYQPFDGGPRQYCAR